MANISFYAANYGITNLGGSGLGFYGASFGSSVAVGSYQDTTFITDANGTIQNEQVNNIKWMHPSSGSINGAAPVSLVSIPNYLATLNMRFTHSTAVQVQNWRVYAYDRTSYNNLPSGVTTKIAELIHTDTVQNPNGSGDSTWITNPGTGVTMYVSQSPGVSGIYAGNGTSSTRGDTRHDVYLAISQSPDSIGSKTLNGLYTSLEYL
jgi:hypothetical protein